jgi:Mn-dependent DtxR family transcriptional regulator
VRGLFEGWAQQIEEEILSFIKEKESIHPEEIAAHLKISKESAHYFLSRLAQKGKIQFKVEPEKSSA